MEAIQTLEQALEQIILLQDQLKEKESIVREQDHQLNHLETKYYAQYKISCNLAELLRLSMNKQKQTTKEYKKLIQELAGYKGLRETIQRILGFTPEF